LGRRQVVRQRILIPPFRWFESSHPSQIKMLVYQALIKRIPQDLLESFIFEKYNNINNLQKVVPSKTSSESHNAKMCDAKCDAIERWSEPFLWLRNNVFYCRMELPRVNGKRRYKRFSLHTSNYYEARTLMEKQKQLAKDLQELRQLFSQLDFIEPDPPQFQTSGKGTSDIHFITLNGEVIKTLSSLNPKSLLEKVWNLYQRVKASKNQLSKEDLRILNIIQANQKQFLGQLSSVLQETIAQAVEPLQQQLMAVNPPQQGPPPHPIHEVLNTMLLKGNNCKSEQTKKRNIIQMLLGKVNITVMDDYSKFHHSANIEEIATYIKDRTDIKGDSKRKHLRYIKEFVTCACNLEPDFYKLNVIANLPRIERTKKAEKNPHIPYTEEELLTIFDPKHDFFKDNPDYFWVCMVALFTGARQNAAFTLQYDDVAIQEGLNCIHFIENHPIKELKNDASERFVPIHEQLLDLGFLDYIKRKRSKSKAKGTDFIFSKCQTKNGTYNPKPFTREFPEFLKNIGVKSKVGQDKHDFHSFRKNANQAMRKAIVDKSFVNDVIGWTGENIAEQAYCNHNLAQIKEQLDKFEYDFLKPHFAEWKKFMAKKP